MDKQWGVFRVEVFRVDGQPIRGNQIDSVRKAAEQISIRGESVEIEVHHRDGADWVVSARWGDNEEDEALALAVALEDIVNDDTLAFHTGAAWHGSEY